MTTTQLMPLTAFTNWLATGERGISSETIVGHLTGVRIVKYSESEPYDPADFRRCERLLRAVPLARLWLPTMRSKSEVWARLVAHWDELVALGEEEVPGIFDTAHARGNAPQMYARMQELRNPPSPVTESSLLPEEQKQ